MIHSKLIVGCIVFFFLLLSFRQDVTRKKVYTVLEGNALESVDQLISQLESNKTDQLSQAYLGALMMKKADLIKGAGPKLKQFKKGAEILEKIIEENPNNAEYRLLRLIIQENAPKILKYNKEIQNDKSLIITQFGKLDKSLQEEITIYSKSSEVLNNNEFLNRSNR